MRDKESIRRLLSEGRVESLSEEAGSGSQLFRVLISLAFDKEDLVCWRAIEAVGTVAGEMSKVSPDRVRTLVQRLLWMLRDESGNNISSAPEILGEIVRNAPEAFSDIAPILASFHDEEGLRRGVLRGVLRIAEVAPELARQSDYLCREYLQDPDPLVRAYAVFLARALRFTDCLAAIEALASDGNEVRLYLDGSFRTLALGKIARETVILLRQGKNRNGTG